MHNWQIKNLESWNCTSLVSGKMEIFFYIYISTIGHTYCSTLQWFPYKIFTVSNSTVIPPSLCVDVSWASSLFCHLRWPWILQGHQNLADQTWNCLYITVLCRLWHFSVWQLWRGEAKTVRSLACLWFPSWPFQRCPSVTPWQYMPLSIPSGLIWNNVFFFVFFLKVKRVIVMDSSSHCGSRSQSGKIWQDNQLCTCVCLCLIENLFKINKYSCHPTNYDEYFSSNKAIIGHYCYILYSNFHLYFYVNNIFGAIIRANFYSVLLVQLLDRRNTSSSSGKTKRVSLVGGDRDQDSGLHDGEWWKVLQGKDQ